MNKAGLERNENIFLFTNAWFSGQALARCPEVQSPVSQEGGPFIDKRGAIRMVGGLLNTPEFGPDRPPRAA
jgi:hypothetical protein